MARHNHLTVIVLAGKTLTSSECSDAKSCSTLCDPTEYNAPGFPAYGILSARILKWEPFPSPGNPPTQEQTHVSEVSYIGRQILYHQHHQGRVTCSDAYSVTVSLRLA